jgi:hypothetical protein
MRRRPRDESGTALILAIVFTVVIGLITSATLSTVASGLNDRVTLDAVRNREYSADGGIEYAIAQIRGITPSTGYQGPALSPCGPYYNTLNGVTVRVDCAGAPTFTLSQIEQQNVVFTACVKKNPDVVCGGSTTPVIIRAQVNFEATGSGTNFNITRTWIQSWSVNG